MSLPAAAEAAGCSRQWIHALRASLGGRREHDGRWTVDARLVREYALLRRARGRWS